MKNFRSHLHLGHFLVTLLIFSTLTSCGPSTYNLKAEPIQGYVVGSKIPLTVNLVLSEDFSNYKPTLFFYGQGDFTLNLAEPMLSNTKKMAGDIFERVIIVDKSQSSVNHTFQATLEPKVVLTSWNRPKWANNDMESAIFIEWSFVDRTGKLIWVDTVKGIGVARITRKEESLERALENLFIKSYDRIYKAYEIRRFATK